MDIERHLPELLDAATRGLRPPIEELYAASTVRGRRALRRRAAATAAGVVGMLALAATVVAVDRPGAHTAAHGSPGSSSAHRPSAATGGAAHGVQIDLAAWSVHTNTDATVTVTVRRGLDLPHLRQVLDSTGVHAVIIGMGLTNQQPWCTETAGESWMPRIRNSGGVSVMTLDPAAIPAGTTLRLAVFSLVDNSAPADPVTHSQPVTMSMGLYTGLDRACVVPTDPGAATGH